ncbi:MAG: trypsin-like peptidase domain-containing protein [Bacteroidales bacterium]|nr:trypsin-like peptidase domain-containing protein [Bacteroidales bacterium]
MNKIGILLKCCLLSGFLIFVSSVSAQISYGGQPYSFSNQGLRARTAGAEDVSTYIVEDLDREEIKRELEERGGNCRECSDGFYYGKEVYTRIDFFRSAQKIETDNDEKVWLLKIESEKAEGYQLIFSKFKMAKGAKLFVYNEDRSMLLGSFTSENNREDKTFLTQYINGRSIYVEYVAPAGAKKSTIFIDRVVYIFDKCFTPNKGPFSPDGSAACQINTSCLAGSGYDVEIKSALMILLKDSVGEYWGHCSGVLVNDGTNYVARFKPLVFTSNHCYENSKGELGEVADWLFLFRHESSSCSSDGSDLIKNTTKSALGAKVLSRDEGSLRSDYLLLELNNTVKDIAKYDVAFAGYSFSESFIPLGSTSEPLVGVYHPEGDVKKILISEAAATSTGWNKPGDDHWDVRATTGFKTEPGASGSPLFNHKHQVIGVCHGGVPSVTCNSPLTERITCYGKLSDANKNSGDLWGYLMGTEAGTYVPPIDGGGPSGYDLTIQPTVTNAVEDQQPIVKVFLQGQFYKDKEVAILHLTVNKQPFDDRVYYPLHSYSDDNYYYVAPAVTLGKSGNNSNIAVLNNYGITLPQLTAPGEYKAVLRISREANGHDGYSIKEFRIVVKPAGEATCGNVTLEIINPQQKYAPGSRITLRESAQLSNTLKMNITEEEAGCYSGSSAGKECLYWNTPRFYGIGMRAWSISGNVVSADTFNTAYEYKETNPGKYYTPSSKQIELTAPGVIKAQVLMRLTAGYVGHDAFRQCYPDANKYFLPFGMNSSEAIYAYKKIVVADCNGDKIIATPKDPLLLAEVSDKKSVGAGTIEIRGVEFFTALKYSVEAYKSITIKPGTTIPLGADFSAKIVPCPSVVRSALAEAADFRAPEILPTGEMTSTDVLDSNSSEIVVYPNPTSGVVNMMTPEYVEINKVALYDMNGSLLKTIDSATSLHSLDLSFLDNGAYVLQISSSVGKSEQQILIRK